MIRALEDRGFAFSSSSLSYVELSASHMRNVSSSSLQQSQSQPLDSPQSPLPSTVPELQARTFALLSKRGILPEVHRRRRLLNLAGRGHDPDLHELQTGVTQCIIHPPAFFSLTLTASEQLSLLICADALPLFGPNANEVLLGGRGDYLLPITLDLGALPFEATGIVCGLSGRLVDNESDEAAHTVETKYLSTAKGATIMIDEDDVDRAVGLLSKGKGALEVRILE